MYDIGDKVVYPHHGAGTVVKKERREVLGEQREYLTIKILHNEMTVQVPSENAEKVGLRRVIGEKEVGVVVKALTGVSTEMPKNWNRRFKHNRDKMKTGDILELAEVVRNLALRDREKGLSTGEKQMFVKAKKILASELMYAKDMDEETCADWLEEVLASDSPPKKKPAVKKKAAAAATPSDRDPGHVRLGHPRRRGAGERLGLDRPKAFANLGDEPLLAEPLRRLEGSPWVDGIVLVAPPGWEEPAILLAEEEGCGKVHACVAGGETRSDSVRAGLAEVPADALVVLVHDAARPLITDEVVERVIAPLSEGWDGVVPGLPVGDTLKRVGADGGVEETVPRDGLWAVQTPQAFAAETLRRAQRSRRRCDRLCGPRRGGRGPGQGRRRAIRGCSR